MDTATSAASRLERPKNRGSTSAAFSGVMTLTRWSSGGCSRCSGRSGLPYAFLRNGWYLENYTENLAPALQHGALVGSANGGRIAAAARADYADAAVAVLTGPVEKKVYELAGDHPFTMSELAAEVSRQAGKLVAYRDLPPDQYRAVLTGAGLPASYADLLVDADVQVARGELDDSTGELRRLIGRPTTPLAAAVRVALGR